MKNTAITSRHNPQIKAWTRWLQHPHEQRQDNVILMEGAHGIITGLQQGFQCRLLIVDENLPLTELSAFSSQIVVCITCPSSLISSLSSLKHMDERGMLAVFDYPRPQGQPTIHDDILILDRLQDPGNVGTLLRTSAALGIRWIIAMKNTVALWHPKVLRSAQGAHFQLSLQEDIAHDTLLDFHQRTLHQRPLMLADGKGTPATHCNLKTPLILVLGHEGQGIHAQFSALPHQRLAVPMTNGIESLNVAVAGSLLMYEQWRQRQ